MSPDQTMPYGHDEVKAWKQNNQLVLSRTEPTLPDRCVKCNSAASKRLKRKYYWCHPAWLITLFMGGWPIYFLAYFITRKGIELQIGLCDEHFSKRQRLVVVSCSITAIGIAMLILMGVAAFVPVGSDAGSGFSVPLVALSALALPTLLAGPIFGLFCLNVITVNKIDDRYAWFGRVNNDYLAMMPDFPPQ